MIKLNLNHFIAYSNVADSKNRSRAIGFVLRPLLTRHRKRTLSYVMSRWFEHSKLIEIHRLYKEDMIANQDEFVYVTWQERERHRLALAYLERAKKRSETNKSARQLQKKLESNQSSAGNQEDDESHHHATLSTLGNNQLENKS